MKARVAILGLAIFFLMACSTQAFAFAGVFRACFKSLAKGVQKLGSTSPGVKVTRSVGKNLAGLEGKVGENFLREISREGNARKTNLAGIGEIRTSGFPKGSMALEHEKSFHKATGEGIVLSSKNKNGEKIETYKEHYIPNGYYYRCLLCRSIKYHDVSNKEKDDTSINSQRSQTVPTSYSLLEELIDNLWKSIGNLIAACKDRFHYLVGK
jgi:hypothetical protein